MARPWWVPVKPKKKCKTTDFYGWWCFYVQLLLTLSQINWSTAIVYCETKAAKIASKIYQFWRSLVIQNLIIHEKLFLCTKNNILRGIIRFTFESLISRNSVDFISASWLLWWVLISVCTYQMKINFDLWQEKRIRWSQNWDSHRILRMGNN